LACPTEVRGRVIGLPGRRMRADGRPSYGLKRERLKAYFKDCPELLSALDGKNLKQPREVFDFYLEKCMDNAPK